MCTEENPNRHMTPLKKKNKTSHNSIKVENECVDNENIYIATMLYDKYIKQKYTLIFHSSYRVSVLNKESDLVSFNILISLPEKE